jgi:xanthine dehydrogenase YagS FAD-binding subunit
MRRSFSNSTDRRLGAGRRARQLRLAQGSNQEAEGCGRSERNRGTPRSSHDRRRHRDRRDDHAHRSSESSLIKQKYDLLAQAAELVASPQIRNQGTIGGNVSQDTRCWYYRGGWPCYRAGGNICYADTPEGRNREHAILHADRCVAVNPSDSAPALIALDAKFVVRTPKGERVVDAEDYFIGPDIDITRLHILQPGDLLTAIRIPSTWAGAQFYFEKVRDRNVWDFPLMNVASAMVTSGDRIERIRIAVNGAAARPLRLKAVEDAVRGKPRNAATGEMAGKLAVQGAVPLQFNAYKIPLMRNLVKRAIGGVEEATWAS